MDVNRYHHISITFSDSHAFNAVSIAMKEDLKRRLVFRAPRKDEESAPTAVERIIYDVRKCERCENLIDNEDLVLYSKRKTPKPHWSAQCVNCGLYLNPNTGEFNCTRQNKDAILRENLKTKDK